MVNTKLVVLAPLLEPVLTGLTPHARHEPGGAALLALAVPFVLLAVSPGRLRQARSEPLSTVEWPAPVPDPSAMRAQALTRLADGTRADWDAHIRPVLAREFTEQLRAKREPDTPAAAGIGEHTFGPDLWPLVDPAAPFGTEPDRPGPGRTELSRILERLERL